MAGTGVFPVYNNVFKIGSKGRASAAEDMVAIADLETFSPVINGKKENWTPMDQSGWDRNAITGKGLTITFKGKRNYGDAGNDYIGNKLLSTGQDCESVFEWDFPNGAKIKGNCVIDLKIPAGGDTIKIDTLEFDILFDGKPIFTPAAG